MTARDTAGATPSPLVAVLTPVCNGERYLAACIESVLAQTHADWRYVIVDNASTDATPEVARRYAERDGRIRVVRNPARVGVIENHNLAFATVPADAGYCKVVHADDWLFPECLARMVALARGHPTIGVVSAYRLKGDWVDLDGLPYPSTLVPGRQVCRQSLLGGPYVFGSPTSVLFRADLVRRRQPFYDPASLHADEAACYDVLAESDFGFVHQVLTCTRTHEATVTSSVARRLDTRLPANLAILDRYGPVFLTPAEHARRRAERLQEYYRGLARGLLRRREPEFWAYHRRALAAAGAPLSRWRLARAVAAQAAAAVVQPGPLLRRPGAGAGRLDPAATTRAHAVDEAARRLAVAGATARARQRPGSP